MIYVISSGPDFIKVGHTDHSAEARAYELQCGNPVTLEVLFTCNGNVTFERMLHRMLKEYHVRGEWFRSSQEVLSSIRRASKFYNGLPKDSSYLVSTLYRTGSVPLKVICSRCGKIEHESMCCFVTMDNLYEEQSLTKVCLNCLIKECDNPENIPEAKKIMGQLKEYYPASSSSSQSKIKAKINERICQTCFGSTDRYRRICENCSCSHIGSKRRCRNPAGTDGLCNYHRSAMCPV